MIKHCWIDCKNVDIAILSLNFKLPVCHVHGYNGTIASPEPLSEQDAEFITDISKLYGITDIHTSLYQIQIHKQPGFDWSLLKPHVLRLVTERYGAEQNDNNLSPSTSVL